MARDAYLDSPCLQIITVSRCTKVMCSSLCMANPLCTAFNVRPFNPGYALTGGLCELQDRVPWPDEDFVDEAGSFYYAM